MSASDGSDRLSSISNLSIADHSPDMRSTHGATSPAPSSIDGFEHVAKQLAPVEQPGDGGPVQHRLRLVNHVDGLTRRQRVFAFHRGSTELHQSLTLCLLRQVFMGTFRGRVV